MYWACIEEVLFLSKQLTILINMHLHYFYCVSRPSASAYRAIVVVYASGPDMFALVYLAFVVLLSTNLRSNNNIYMSSTDISWPVHS